MVDKPECIGMVESSRMALALSLGSAIRLGKTSSLLGFCDAISSASAAAKATTGRGIELGEDRLSQ